MEKMVGEMGKRMRDDGWKGLFGVDVILDSKTGKIYLLEINARQSASATYESQLQKKSNPSGLSVFEAHLASLLGLSTFNLQPSTILDGAQIIARHTNAHIDTGGLATKLRQMNLTVIEYENNAHNADALRIQSGHSLIENVNILNDTGKQIASILNPHGN